MARVSPVDKDDIPDEWKHAVEYYNELGDDAPDEYTYHIDDPSSSFQDREPPSAMYSTLGNNPQALDALRRLWGQVRQNGGLTQYQRELVVLTVASRTRSRMIWDRHVSLALNASVPVEGILAIEAGRLDPFDDLAAALIDYVTAFVERDVTDEHHERLAESFDDSEIVAVNILAGSYLMLAHAVDALDVGASDPFVGWELENLENHPL